MAQPALYNFHALDVPLMRLHSTGSNRLTAPRLIVAFVGTAETGYLQSVLQQFVATGMLTQSQPVMWHTCVVLVHSADSRAVMDAVRGHRGLQRPQQSPPVDPPEFMRRSSALVYEHRAQRAPILPAKLDPAHIQE